METLINDQRPTLILKIQDIEFLGLIDTRADVSIFSLSALPTPRDKQKVQITLSGLGSTRDVFQTSLPMTCVRPEGQTAVVSFYIMDISTHLWGRDVLKQFGVFLNIPFLSPQAKNIMMNMGFDPFTYADPPQINLTQKPLN